MTGPATDANRIRVWAPRAGTVEIECGGRRLAMEGDGSGDGWWSVEHPDLVPGSDYAFFLDGEGPFPDPRSRCQPRGVHGPSRIVDPSSFAWTDDGWEPPALSEGLVYELHVGTFTPEGTFDSAIARLDHLVELGVTHVEIMPVAQFPGRRGWGYDGVDLFAPHDAYGGPDGLARFVDACHGSGLAVLLDVVYNHLGPDGNHLARFGPYFTDRYATPWGEAVNLDGAGSDEVRRFFCDNALMWLRDYHLDGLRLDAVHAIFDMSAIHFLEQLAAEVQALEAQLGRSLVLVAESDLNDPRIVRSSSLGGYGLDAQWDDDFHHALHALLTGESSGYYADFGTVADLAKALSQAFVYDGCHSRYRGRRHGRVPRGLSGDRFVAFAQNHDQVGNRACGERLTQLVSPSRARLAAAVLLTSPFVPMLFMGEEWGASTPFLYFTDHQDEDLGGRVREGRRREFAAFGWDPESIPDPQAAETWERSRLDWSEREREPHREIHRWHRDLLRLRRERAELRDGGLDRVRVRFEEAARWLTCQRGRIVVACNFAGGPRSVPLPGEPARVLLASDDSVEPGADGIRLPAESVAIVELPD